MNIPLSVDNALLRTGCVAAMGGEARDPFCLPPVLPSLTTPFPPSLRSGLLFKLNRSLRCMYASLFACSWLPGVLQEGEWIEVGRTEVVDNNLNPLWDSQELNLRAFCDCRDDLVISVDVFGVCRHGRDHDT